MEYERIQKAEPQLQGSLSPSKLRLRLLSIQKKRKEEADAYSPAFTTKNDVMDDLGANSSDDCKDVTMVCPEASFPNSTFTVLPNEKSYPPKDITCNGGKSNSSSVTRSNEDSNSDYDSGREGNRVGGFQFQRSEKPAQHRVVLPHVSKTAPSKWDDAGKWVANPVLGDHQQTSKSKLVSKKSTYGSQGNQHRKSANNRQPKILTEVADQVVYATEDLVTRKTETTQIKKEIGEHKLSFVPIVTKALPKSVSWELESYLVADSLNGTVIKPAVVAEAPISSSAITTAVCLSKHDSTLSLRSSTTFIEPPSTVRSVSMRDMGTEMTPIASQDPSRTGTPIRATTPTRSPSSSRPPTPGRVGSASSPTNGVNKVDHNMVHQKKELSERELQLQTRREIAALGAQLGKMNIAAWASKEEEDKDASTSLKVIDIEQTPKSVIETRAAAWVEAEHAKSMARYKSEEIKIQAWENHQKAKTEAELRKIEVEVERMRAGAHEKMMNKLATARHKAEEKRAAAEAKRNQHAAKTAEQAEYIRRTGRIPASFNCCSWCF